MPRGGPVFRRKRRGDLLTGMRGLLLSTDPLEQVATRYAESPQEDSPWAYFAAAQQALSQGDENTAIRELRTVVETVGLESRTFLQAWHCLRTLGEAPTLDVARQIRGVVVESGLKRGADVVAAYADHSARYFLAVGGGVISNDPEDREVAPLVDDLLAAGQVVVDDTDPLDEAPPPAPPEGTVLINLLTFGGLHARQDEFARMDSLPLDGPVLRAATALMTALVAKAAAAADQR
jgi:hypothetical protein